jgi:N-acetylmuramoyl-L-alanine amidase
MKALLGAIALVSLASCVADVPLLAADSARLAYSAVRAREQSVREMLASDTPGDPQAIVGDVRAVVAAYRDVVKRHPASAYSDDALWLAARLSIDAYLKFGQEPDKINAIRLLKALPASYPSSTFAKRVSEQLARLKGQTAAPPSSRYAAAGSSAPVPTPAPVAAAPLAAAATSDSASKSVTATRGSAQLTTIKAIRRIVMTDTVRVVIEFDGEVAFHDERISSPLRVFLDLPSTRAVPTLRDQTLRFEGDSDIVRQIRVGRPAEATTRVVLDAAGVSSYSVYPLYSPFRIVIDCVRGTEPAAPALLPLEARKFAVDWNGRVSASMPSASRMIAAALAPPPLLQARRVSTEWARTLPAGTAAATAIIAAAIPPPPPALPAPTIALAAKEPAKEPAPLPDASIATASPDKNVNGGFSMARQLGLGVSRIVIDPGHGGHDPGAKGKGVDEAELVLDIALRVEKLLQKVPQTEVILTRKGDDYVPLQERTAIANRESADLFLSIHANASTNATVHGIETYFLNFADNMNAASVAARENAASGQTMGALPDFVKAIALNNKLDESRDFATQVQHAMVARLQGPNKDLKDLGVKQAPFVVLIGAAMPSVLAEISFVTNPQEARLLKSNAYRQRIAEALFEAIRKYQTSLQKVATVAHQ